ncbi:hypothetical protein CEXT_200701 [Caerostris extrusa]|uniref:Uncharacterized protein n=1 Tax=Caerostris extrusa TaxID=172846 RepID=A0AAV4XEL5_CAEEX|nr:hypothetical protein CEXT_200701 [Caerostris extrusa]
MNVRKFDTEKGIVFWKIEDARFRKPRVSRFRHVKSIDPLGMLNLPIGSRGGEKDRKLSKINFVTENQGDTIEVALFRRNGKCPWVFAE